MSLTHCEVTTSTVRIALAKEHEISTSSNSHLAPSLDTPSALPVESYKAASSSKTAPRKLSPSRRRRKFRRRVWDLLKRGLSGLGAFKLAAGERISDDLGISNDLTILDDLAKADIRTQIDAASVQSIELELDCGVNCEGSLRYQTRRGKAMIDIHTEYSLISRRFADLSYQAARSTELEKATPFQVIETLAGPANALVETTARWHCEINPNVAVPWRRMNPKMVSSKFYIMELPCDYDVIIGRRDIVEFDLMGIKKHPLAAAHLPEHFRSQPAGEYEIGYHACLPANST
jgi:hypothetical protein